MSDSRKTLLCPNCGAPLPPGVTHETVTCAFCGTSSALADLKALASRSDLVCPRCEQKLFFGEANGVSMLGCGLCGGIWLDNESAQRVMSRFDDAVVQLASRASMNAVKRPDVRAEVKCAQCREPMKRNRVANVDLDVCAAHGTWFDAGELATVLAMMRPLPPPQTEMAAAQFPAPPVFTDVDSSSSSSGIDWGGVAGNVAVGAFEVLAAILTD